jgi:clan AA aspartic protease (TIGR02281 family)
MLLFSDLVAADIYKCVDPAGKVGTIYSAAPCGINAQLVISLPQDKPARPAVQEIQPRQSMALALNSGENYSIVGSVKGVPMVYLVDTGASMVSVSKRVMDQAGIYSCVRHVEVFTSNGNVRECVAIVPEITFGIFRMTNVEVAVVPNMSVDGLLGMAALRHFTVSQQDGVMTISN